MVGAERRPGSTINEDNIRRLVHGFYEAVREDSLLEPVFGREIVPGDWPAHLDKMCDFWSSVMNTTGRYKGRPIPAHVKLSGVEPRHFSRWLALFRATASA